MTSQQKKTAHKYITDLKKHLVVTFLLITLLLLGGAALAIALHGFQKVYLLFPAMWVLILITYLAKIPFFTRAKKDINENKIQTTHIKNAIFIIDTKNCLKSTKGALVGSPKYILTDGDRNGYLLYMNVSGTTVRDRISLEDTKLTAEYLENTGIVVSMKFENSNEEDIPYDLFKDYI